MGSESEINIAGIPLLDGGKVFRKAMAAVDHVSVGRTQSSIILRNGGEVYFDLGKMAEATTPECTNAHEVLLHELAGERAVLQMANSIAPDGKGSAYKRAGYAEITNTEGRQLYRPATSTGHHENYFYIRPEDAEDTHAQRQMTSYLYTRPIWSGTGMVTSAGYAISQKLGAVDFGKGKNLQDHGNKPPIRLDGQELRMEVRTGEGNISEWAILQKFALTSLILRLIEHKKFPDDLIIDSFAVGNNQSPLRTPFTEVHVRGGGISPISHQRNLARAALDYFENKNVPTTELAAAEAIINVCNQLDTIDSIEEDMSPIDDHVEWASKLTCLRRNLKGELITTDNTGALAIDLRWDDLGEKGIGKRWYRRYSQTTDAETIDTASATPPASRAAARMADLLRLCENGTTINSVTWDEIKYANDEKYRYKDPYEDKAAA